MTKEELTQAADIAAQWSICAEELLSHYDALAIPTAQTWAFPAEWRWPQEIQGRKMTTYHSWMEIVVPGSLGGLPCTTIPAGFGSNDLPMGIQLLGRRGEDARLISMAQAYHLALGRPERRPPGA